MDTEREAAPPAVLRRARDAWLANGQHPQPCVRWSKDSWRRWLRRHDAFLANLPEEMSKESATDLAKSATNNDGAEEAFIAAMIWGYGPVGYGAWRTKRVLEQPRAVERLVDAAEAVNLGGGIEGFRVLSRDPIRYLGVAFGTKYLYFVSSAAVAGGHITREQVAPVLDDVVSRWMEQQASVPLRIDRWNVDDYRSYVELLRSWGSDLDLTIEQVEELIFRVQITADGSRLWTEEWTTDVMQEEPVDVAASRLDELRLALEGLSPDSAQEGAVQLHLDAIASWIAERRAARDAPTPQT